MKSMPVDDCGDGQSQHRRIRVDQPGRRDSSECAIPGAEPSVLITVREPSGGRWFLAPSIKGYEGKHG